MFNISDRLEREVHTLLPETYDIIAKSNLISVENINNQLAIIG